LGFTGCRYDTTCLTGKQPLSQHLAISPPHHTTTLSPCHLTTTLPPHLHTTLPHVATICVRRMDHHRHCLSRHHHLATIPPHHVANIFVRRMGHHRYCTSPTPCHDTTPRCHHTTLTQFVSGAWAIISIACHVTNTLPSHLMTTLPSQHHTTLPPFVSGAWVTDFASDVRFSVACEPSRTPP